MPASVRRCLRPLAACSQLSELHLQGNPLAKDATLRSLFPSLAPCLDMESQAIPCGKFIVGALKLVIFWWKLIFQPLSARVYVN